MSDDKSENASIRAVEEAITGRRSIRAFLPDPVPEALVEHLLDVAARAPSGTNMQPWHCVAVAGAAKAELDAAMLKAFDEGSDEHEYRYYPDPFFEPYQGRRRAVGKELYTLLGIGRGEEAKMKAQHARNFIFFDAPVGIICTIDRRLEIGSWLDYGMFLQNLMIVARAHGLDTCPQAAFAPYHRTIRAVLDIPESEVVVCGVALGYADKTAPENTLVSGREPARSFARFLGFS